MADLIRGSTLLHFGDLVSSLGGDPEALLRAHGVDPSAAGDYDRLVSYAAVASVIGTAAVELACPDFGMRLGKRQGIQILGLSRFFCATPRREPTRSRVFLAIFTIAPLPTSQN